jgi:formylglycine-generating enzyme required for sulfatase activity
MKKTHVVILALLLSLSSFMPFSKAGKLPKSLKKDFAAIPEGSLWQDDSEVRIGSFFLKTTEVTNGEYLEFIRDLERSGDVNQLRVCLPDTQAWRNQMTYNEAFVQYYFRHPAYKNHPVVCVSYEAAQAYCNWKTAKAASEKSKTGATVHYRLPTKAEWIYAAGNVVKSSAYSWGGNDINNKQGCALCNYRQLPGENGSHPEWPVASYDNADVTTIVDAYAPNAWGIYNMNGNAAEMVAEKGVAMGGSWNSTRTEVTNTSETTYTNALPTIGFRLAVEYR